MCIQQQVPVSTFMCKISCVDILVCMQVLNQLAQDFDADNKKAAIPIMYNDEVAYLMESA